MRPSRPSTGSEARTSAATHSRCRWRSVEPPRIVPGAVVAAEASEDVVATPAAEVGDEEGHQAAEVMTGSVRTTSAVTSTSPGVTSATDVTRADRGAVEGDAAVGAEGARLVATTAEDATVTGPTSLPSHTHTTTRTSPISSLVTAVWPAAAVRGNSAHCIFAVH